MIEKKLTGLNGSNPLGFLAAVGLQVALDDEGKASKLWWSDDVVPKAMLSIEPGIDLADVALTCVARLRQSPLFNSGIDGAGDLKFATDKIRPFLEVASSDPAAIRLASCVVSEGSIDRSGKAKPSDLYFTAGQQRFLVIIREILDGVTREDILEAIDGPWSYASELPTLMWDTSDDANYALAARNPAVEKKLTVPGAEALAILGLSAFPVFTGQERTLTTATSGTWKSGRFRWPIWHLAAGSGATRSLIQQIPAIDHRAGSTVDQLNGWGVELVYESSIRRSDQGGYGSFSPPRIIWSRSRT